MSLTGHPHHTSGSRPSDGPNPGQNSGSSNSGGSPPLILAFIAAGFLGAGIIIFFLYRRAAARRTRLVTTPSNDVVASKPILWDVPIQKSPMDLSESSLKGCKWPGITPLSATFTSCLHPPTLETPTSRRQKMLHDLMHFFTRPAFSRYAQTPIALKQSPLTSCDIHGSNTLVQVAVLVAMPSPARSVFYGNPDTKRLWEDEYHLGLTKVPCIGVQSLGH